MTSLRTAESQWSTHGGEEPVIDDSGTEEINEDEYKQQNESSDLQVISPRSDFLLELIFMIEKR